MMNVQIGLACLLVGLGVGMIYGREEKANGPVFVTEGEVFDGQVTMLDKFVEACLAQDATACADLYTEDTVYMVQNQPTLEGYDEVLNSYQALFSENDLAEIEMAEPVQQVLSMGDFAVVRGSGFNITITDGVSEKESYKWLILSQRQANGSWKILWDIYNYDDDYMQ